MALEPKSFTVSFSLVTPQRDLWLFTRITVHGGKGKHTFCGLLDTGSESMLILEDPKKHCGSPVKLATYEGQVINGVSANI